MKAKTTGPREKSAKDIKVGNSQRRKNKLLISI